MLYGGLHVWLLCRRLFERMFHSTFLLLIVAQDSRSAQVNVLVTLAANGLGILHSMLADRDFFALPQVLVVGDSGLGKTTLIKTLLSTPGDRLQVDDGPFPSFPVPPRPPTVLHALQLNHSPCAVAAMNRCFSAFGCPVSGAELAAAPLSPRFQQVHDGSSTPADVFRRDPGSLCSSVSWKDEEDRVVWVYR